MVDEFMICIDRLIASACFESVNEREKLLAGGGDEAVVTQNNLPSVTSNNGGEGCSKKIVRECRICQEEDEENQMEAPCACNGTLKFAHRKCIQRWCNKKGDITCEICYQVYSPNYIVPPPRVSPEVIAIDIRQAWGPHIDLRDPRFLTLTVAQRELLESEYDEYTVANGSSLACFRYVAIMLMFILLIRQVLMLSRDFGVVQDPSTIFNVSLLQLAGFLLPCYVMARSCCIMQNRRRRQIKIGTSSSPILPYPGSPCYKSDGKSDPGSPWYESAELRRYQRKAVGSSTIRCHPMYAVLGQALVHIAAFPIPRTNGSFRVRES